MNDKIYKRFTDLFNKESELINSRISWLFATQTLLWGGLKILNNDSKLDFTIKIIGLSSSTFFLISITAAIITYVRFLFHAHPSVNENEILEYPEFNRWPALIYTGFFAAFALPLVFIWAWLYQLFY